MTQILKMQVVGYRDATGRYIKRTEALQTGLRELARTEARELLGALRFYAPEKSGKFKAGLGYRTDQKPDGVTITFYVGGPHAFLLPIIVGGSKPHTITATKAKALRFYWEHGPEGPGIYYYASVQHPGTIPDPFVALAMASREPHLDYHMLSLSRKVIYVS